MKRMVLCIIIGLVTFTACNADNISQMPEGENFVRLQTEQTVDNNGIGIIKATKELKKGDRGEISIQGKAGKLYRITSTYKVGKSTFTANQSKEADKDGIVTWTWNVDKETHPGTYPLTITGDGTTLLSSYTVID